MNCPECDSSEASYSVMSGGREGYCPDCGNQFPLSLLTDEQQPRAALLKTPEGRIALRAQMDQEMARLRDIRESGQ